MVTAKYLLDTNVLSEPVRKSPSARVIKKIQRHQDRLASASVVWHELAYGCQRLPVDSRQRAVLERYLAELEMSALPFLPYGVEAARWHAQERARLEREGLKPPFVDGQIAAISVVHDLTLVTNNVRNFNHFDKLRVENWHL